MTPFPVKKYYFFTGNGMGKGMVPHEGVSAETLTLC